MYWCILHTKKKSYHELIDFFNAQKDVHAFVPMIEKCFSGASIKEYQNIAMYPDDLFMRTSMDQKEFFMKFKNVFDSMDRRVELLESEDFITLTMQEQELLEKMFDGCEVIKHSTGRIIDSILMIEQGSLVGMENSIQKINRHKRFAYLDCGMFGKTMKVPLEVINKT